MILQSPSLEKARDALLASGTLSPREEDWLRKMQIEVHRKERAYVRDNGEHYLTVGLSALNCIHRAISDANAEAPASILDFPSGYGRVLRLLKAAFPEARIGCMELEPKAVQFCRKIFDADSSPSQRDFSSLQLGESYDLIWCGSLVTHLDETQTRSLLEFFHRHLNPRGLCLFTSHGKTVEENLESGQGYSLSPSQIESVLAEYRRDGFAFTEYQPARDGYGFSLSTDESIRRIAREAGDWECIMFTPAGWDNHQDVYAFQKPG